MREIVKKVLMAGLVGVAFAVSAAYGLSLTGRDSQYQRSILQAGIPAVSIESGITASTTQTLAGAYALTAGVSQITTANSGDAVGLPNMTRLFSPTNLDASLNVVIMNNTANAVNVFPALSTDIIVNNGSAGSAGAALSLPSLKTMECWSASPSGRWYCTIG